MHGREETAIEELAFRFLARQARPQVELAG